MPQSHDARPDLRLLHYWWPVVMGGSAAVVVSRATARPVDAAGLTVLLCGILAAYSLDRILDTPGLDRTVWLKAALQTGAAIGIVVGAVLLALLPFGTWTLVLVLGVLVLAYPRLKSVPLLKTVLLPVVWTWSVIALPFQEGSWFGWHAWTAPVALPLLCLIASGCLLCDLKDAKADREASSPTLPVLMGVNGTIAAAVILSTIGAAIALSEHRIGLLVGGIGLGLAAIRPNLLARDVVGPLLVDVILTVPGLLIVLHIV
jgi:hypothetical protein